VKRAEVRAVGLDDFFHRCDLLQVEQHELLRISRKIPDREKKCLLFNEAMRTK